jgi:broad specificity phosphatase PhoE
MTLRLTLVAHGATSATRGAAFPHDEPLEDRAIHHATLLARRLGHADRVLTGPALRTRQTAEVLGLRAEVDEELRDCDFGRWPGLRLADLAVAEPDGLARWLSDPEFAAHGGESISEVSRRVAAWLDRQASSAAGRMIAVTHPAVIRTAILHAITAPASSFWRIDVTPLSCTDIIAERGRWTLRSIMAGTIDSGPMP